jgi:hypothetical protein
MERWERELAEIRAIMKENAAGFAEMREQQKKTEAENARGFAELREQQRKTEAENARGFAELREEQKKTEEQSRKTDAKIDRLAEKLGGMDDNIGYHAEQYFQNAFNTKLCFGGEKYDYMLPNLKYSRGGISVEFDIVLVNGSSVAIIEVKNRIHENFIKEVAEKKVSQFRKYFPAYESYKIYLGVAGFSFHESVMEKAKEYGVGIIRQAGDTVEIDDKDLKVY